jgi:sec-independent protein translocase protein TatA
MLSGIGIWQLLIVLVIVLLLFGTKRLKGLGGDLGSAIKGFKKAISEEKPEVSEAEQKRVEGEAAEAPKATAQADQTQPQNKQ